MQVLPFILLGSVFALLGVLNDFIPGLPSFWEPFDWTMGKISLFIAFLIPFNLMEKKKFRKQRIIAGTTGLILFLIVITPQVTAEGTVGFSWITAFGAGGMFVAIFCGVFTGIIMGLFGKFSFFKEDSTIPEFVRAWFDAMLPIAIVVCTGWIVILLNNIDIYNIIIRLIEPMGKFLETPYGFIFWLTFSCFLYSMGISTWILTPVTTPFLLAAITSNMALVASGVTAASELNLVTSETVFSAYIWVGGTGCTLPLIVMMLFSKSQYLKSLGRACFVPGVFNINEPVVFGAIAWNPLLMLPMWIQGIILPIIVWIFTKVIHFAPIPTSLFEMWYVPFPISTWLTTGSVKGLLLLTIIVIVATMIWYPFFKTYEMQEVKKEQQSS